MPRKVKSETAENVADLTNVQSEDNQTAAKPARRKRLTADDILAKAKADAEAINESNAQKAEKPSRAKKAKAEPAAESEPKKATKPVTAKATKPKAAPKKPDKAETPSDKAEPKGSEPAAKPKTAAPKPVAKKAETPKAAEQKPVESPRPKGLFGRKTLAEELQEASQSDPELAAVLEEEPEEPEAIARAARTRPAAPVPPKEDSPTVDPQIEPTEVPKFQTRKSPKKEERRRRPEPASRAKTSEKTAIENPFGLNIQLSWRTNAESKDEQEPERPTRPERSSDRRPTQPTREVSEIDEANLPEPIDLGDEAGRMKILMWRSNPAAQSETRSAPRLAPRKSNPRRQQDQPEGKINAADAYGETFRPVFRETTKEPKETAVEAAAPVKEEPALPEIPVRQPIARREEAAQVVVHEGHPKIIKDKVAYAPFVFFTGPAQGKTEGQVIDQIRLANEHGVRLFMVAFDLVNDPDRAKEIAEDIIVQTKAVASATNDAQVIARLNFVPANNWKKEFPDARDLSATVGRDKPSLCDDAYWKSAEETLVKVIGILRKSDVAETILGVHLDRDRWEFNHADGYDTSVAATNQFRLWLRQRYRNDIVTLRASWFDGKAEFDKVEIPSPGFTDRVGEFVRTDRKARRWIDYHLFLSDITVERIGELCYAAKSASEGDYLVGVTYGATFESSHPASGQLSLGKLLRCPEVDYISAAPNFESIAPGDAAPFPFPVDSFALNGKMFLTEEDYRTPIAGQSGDESGPLMKTPQALEAVHWRGAGAAFAHKGGVVWCDHKGKGWLNSRGIWERAAKIRETLLRTHLLPTSNPEVAVFIDERSLTYLADEKSFKVLIQDVREAAIRSGLSVGFYLLSDLAHRENFPESKLHVFLNAWDMRPEVRSAIKSRLQRDNKVLFWLYTAGLFEAGRESLERVREVTGIALRPQPFNSKSGTTVLNTVDPLGQAIPQDQIGKGGELEPSYFAIPEDGNIIAEYTSTGLPSLLVKPFEGETPEQNWTSVFLGEPMVTPQFFRALGQLAGCHVWNFDNDIVHAAAPHLTVHCTETSARTITLPNKWVAYNLATQDYMPVENSTVKFKALDGASYSFLVGTIGDVQTMVKADVESIRKITSPIIRDENTLHWDTVRFDVEIMKLDEWVEETWGEDLADDLLLKPSSLGIDAEALVEDPEEVEETRSEPGRRRRKRRGRKGERRNDFGGGADPRDGDDGIGVLFRKRG